MEKLNPIDLSLNFMDDIDSSVSFEDYRSKAYDIFARIVRERFPSIPSKQKVHYHTDRITGACPYCGDSMQSYHKKRGNIILTGKFAGFYKCFNCGVFKPADIFFKDYNIDVQLDVVNYLIESRGDFKSESYGSYDISLLVNPDEIDKYSIDMDTLKKSLDLQEIPSGWISNWLRGRLHFNFSKFLWNPVHEYLVILNLTRSGKVLGFQRRNFRKGSEKYLTYNASRISRDILKAEIDVPEFINSISQVYDICFIDFNRTITLFEGPLDSFLFKNSIANTGANKTFPLDVPIRYWFDDDETGRRVSLEKISKGEEVFLWSRIKRDLDVPYRPKWDLNDLMIWIKSEGKRVPLFDNYFSGDPLDSIDI